MSVGMKEYYAVNPYAVAVGGNGVKFVDWHTVRPSVNLSYYNSKVGPAMAFNLPIEYTCNHTCACYGTRACYACHGHYVYANNQAVYAENYAAFRLWSAERLVNAIVDAIKACSLDLFRWFTCGDIAGTAFLKIMVDVAHKCPEVKFWSYTKKYDIVNRWIDANGPLPDNLTIIFSHWRNDDGTYFPMSNPYKLPTSEFIPFGMEYLAESVTHVCPCSDPAVKATCATCEHPCYALKVGQSMALLEHSTARTAARDKAVRAAHARL